MRHPYSPTSLNSNHRDAKANPHSIRYKGEYAKRFAHHRLTAPQSSAQRRKPYVVEAWLASPTARDPKDRHEVVGVNISRHGIAFELPVAVATGAYFVFQVGNGVQQLKSEVRILSCKKHDGRYRIGAEFC